MSTFEVNRQLASVANAGWASAKSGDAPAGQGEDAGAFSALLEGLADEPAARRLPSERRGGREAGGETPEKSDASSRTRISQRLSALLDGEKTVQDGDTEGEKDTLDIPSPHLQRQRLATRQAGSRGQGEDASHPPVAGNVKTRDGAASKAEDGTSHPVRAHRPDDAEAASTDPRLHSSATDAAGSQIPVLQQNPASAVARLVEGEPGQGANGQHPQAANAEGGDDAAGEAPVQVKVLSRETHFAPANQASLATDGQPPQPFTLPTPGEAAPAVEGAKAPPHPAPEPPAEGDEHHPAPERRAEAKVQAAREASVSARGEAAGTAPEGDKPASGPAPSGTQGWTLTAQQGMPLANLRQVSQAIGAEIARMASAAPNPDAPQAQGPVRLLDIQLNPASLGTVTVRMRVSGAGLEVKLHASNPETARLLKQDQARLTEMLRAEGLEAASVSVVDGSDAAGAWNRFEMPRQTFAGSSFTRQGEDQRSSDQRQGDGSSRNGQNEDETPSGRRDRSGGDRR